MFIIPSSGYLTLAEKIEGDISARVQFFGQKESTLIETNEGQFRFHSGAPESTLAIA